MVKSHRMTGTRGRGTPNHFWGKYYIIVLLANVIQLILHVALSSQIYAIYIWYRYISIVPCMKMLVVDAVHRRILKIIKKVQERKKDEHKGALPSECVKSIRIRGFFLWISQWLLLGPIRAIKAIPKPLSWKRLPLENALLMRLKGVGSFRRVNKIEGIE